MKTNRQDRRIARRQIGELAAKAKVVRSELFAAATILAENEAVATQSDEVRASNSSLRGDVRRGIEAYVDALGQLASVDDRATSPAFADDEPLYHLLAANRWCGATTAAQARDALLEEVKIRSVGKSDLGLLFSSIDHTAYRLYGTMPEPFKEAHGEDLVEGIVQHLLGEEFDKTLAMDPRWAEMRKRWVRLGWRGSDADTFNAAFVRATAERTAAIHDGKGEVVDTILDEQMQRARPETRKKMMDAFAERLGREWELILRQRAERASWGESVPAETKGFCPFCGKPVSIRWGDPPIDPGHLTHAEPTCAEFNTMTADDFVRAVIDRSKERERRLPDGSYEIDVPLNRDEARRLDTIAARWGTTRNGAMERIVRERTAEEAAKLSISTDARATILDEIRAEHPNIKLTEVPPDKQSTVPYSDHELMRRGRGIWEVSYARGMSDEELRDAIGSLNKNSFADEIVFFATKWAVHAFQRLMTSHTFAAALMCSDVQKEVLDGIEKQWDAFMVIVPNGMLVASGFEFSRILVATYSFGAKMILLTLGGPAISTKMTGTIVDEAPTLADLLVSDGSDLAEDAVSRRCLVMAKRLVAGLLLNLQHPPNFKIRPVEARPKSKKREAEPEHRIVTIGKPLEIDCRESVKEYIEHGKAGRKHGPPTVQVMVRGHYRRQACGVGRMERKTIWIEPFWRGPEAALIQTRAKVPS